MYFFYRFNCFDPVFTNKLDSKFLTFDSYLYPLGIAALTQYTLSTTYTSPATGCYNNFQLSFSSIYLENSKSLVTYGCPHSCFVVKGSHKV